MENNEKTIYCGNRTQMGHGEAEICGKSGAMGVYQCANCRATQAEGALANLQQSAKQEYSGTPEEVGAQLAVDALGPTIAAAAEHSTDQQLTRMMAGMIAGLAGIVAANFGPEATLDILRGTAENVERGAAQPLTPH